MSQVEGVLGWLGENESASIDRMVAWLSIPSVSTDSAFAGECRRAADWAAAHLRESGLEVEVLPTGGGEGRPVVLAEAPGAEGYTGPHVLFYGHYDVQPADPLELWESAPFEPLIKEADGEVGAHIVARGASDDKGQVMCFLETLRAWKEVAGLVAGGVRVTVLLEGEEESGSVNLERFIDEHRARFEGCDVCLISDTGMLGRNKPAITYGVRGLTYTEVVLHGPDRDLHSGMWGGKCPNPINELAKVLGQLWDSDRRVTVDGFYDDVRDPTPDERAAWAGLGVDESALLGSIGLGAEASVGEAGWSFIEREWARPTCDINGIVGGYTGEGAKTVIPSHASAKVSFRLVADQDPAKVTAAFFAWLKARTPAGCRWEMIDHGGGLPATTPTESGPLKAAMRALDRAGGEKAAMIKTGGSIPIAGLLKERLGLDTLFMGFGLDDDRVHSPNEKFELDCFRLGARAHALFLDELTGG